MATQTLPKTGEFKMKCAHCGSVIGKKGRVKLAEFECKTHECPACHELTLLRDCQTFVILNKVIS